MKDKGWTECTMGDCCVVGDGAHAKLQRRTEGILYLSAKNIKSGGLDYSKVDYISEADFAKHFRHNSKALTKPVGGDVLFSIIGSIGEPYLVKPTDQFGISSSIAIIRPDLSATDALYLYYWIKGPIFQRALYGIKGGVAQGYVSLEMIKSLPLKYPPLPAQQKIAAILSAYDDLIENNSRRIQLLETMAQALYREWFVNFRFPGHEQVKLVKSPLGMIPEGWEVKTLKDVCELINYGYTASADQKPVGPKFLRITDIVPYLINWDAVPFCQISERELEKYLLKEGDIVIARTGATTGYAKRINKRSPKSVFASYLVRVRIHQAYSNLYFGLIIESDEYKRFIKANLGGAAQPQANAQVLTSMQVLIPPAKVLKSFDSIIEGLFDQRELLQVKNEKLRQTRDLLLPKLISGEVDVSALDINTAALAG